MDAATLLDILGNENRRRILELLSWKPCFVSEISDRLGVGPKAVIRHLELLENSGLVENYVDEQRRKYYHITDNIRIEISLSPFAYGVEAASISIRETPKRQRNSNLPDLYAELKALEERRRELAEAQKRVQASITGAIGACIDAIEDTAQSNIESQLMFALLRWPQSADEVSRRLMLPRRVALERLHSLRGRGLVEEENGVWKIKKEESHEQRQ